MKVRKRYIIKIIAILLIFGAITGVGMISLANTKNIFQGFFSSQYDEIIEQNFGEAFCFSDELRNIKNEALLRLGVKEYNGVFLLENKLIEDYTPPENDKTEANTQIVNIFISHNRPDVYFLLIPTQCAIEQENLSKYVSLYNQKKAIGDIYKQISQSSEKVAGYETLFAMRSKKLYYNTHPNLTSTGGYVIYSAICKSMNKTQRQISEFSVRYVGYGFLGENYDKVLYSKIDSDFVELYDYKSFERNYKVTHITPDGTYYYDGLYILEKEDAKDKTDIIFGGLSPVTELETDGPYTEKALILGDETAKAYLPFLINHYEKITFVDVRSKDAELLKDIEVSEYNQVIFALGIDSYQKYDLAPILKSLKNEWPLDK